MANTPNGSVLSGEHSSRFIYATVAASSPEDACKAAEWHYGGTASHADPTGYAGIWTVTIERY